MEALYERYGWWKNSTISVSFPGAAGADTMKALMASLRTSAPSVVAGLPVVQVVDFATAAPMPVFGGRGNSEPQTLPSANVLELQLEGGHKLIIRPSGTEPKVKAYSFVKGESAEQATELLAAIEAAARELLA